MKPLMLRFVWLLSALLLAMLMIGAAGLAGRGNESPIAVIQINTRDSNRITYALVEIDRRISTAHRRLPVPELVDERWYAQPPLTLQRMTRGESADWTLSA